MAATASINSTSGTAGTTQLKSSKKALQTQDFISLMLTQLKNQDPMNPASNAELMAQMAQIGQLEANSQLQDLLKGMSTQNQLGSAGTLLGKVVQGVDDNNDPVTGMVTSVRVESNQIFLELDNGKTLGLNRVTSISPGPIEQAKGTGTAVAA